MGCKQDIKYSISSYSLSYFPPPPSLLYSWRPGARGGDEKGGWEGVFLCVCMCVYLGEAAVADNWRGTPGCWSPINPDPLPFKPA